MNEAALSILLTLRDEASQELQNVNQRLGQSRTALLALGGAAVAGVGLAAAALYRAGQAAAEEEQAIARLRAAVRASGGDWASAEQAIESYLQAELRRTALDDGEGREAIARLTTATGDYRRALELMPLAQDLAIAKGMDLAAASEIVGRVANGNTSILSRYGITLQEGASATEALAQMQAMFAGQAEEYGQTAAAAQERFNIAMGNLQETVGSYVLPIMAELANTLAGLATEALPIVEEAVGNVVEFIQENAPAIIAGLTAMAVAIGVAVVPAFIAWASAAIASAAATAAALAPVVLPILAIGAAVGLLVTAWNRDWGGIRSTLTAVWTRTLEPIVREIGRWLSEAIPYALGVLSDTFSSAWGAIRDFVKAVWEEALLPIVSAIKRWFTETLPGALETLQSAFSSAWGAIRSFVSTVWNDGLLPVAQAVQRWFTETLPGALGTLQSAFSSAWGAIRDFVTTVWNEKLLPVIEAIKRWFTETLPDALDSLKRKFEEIWDAIKTKVSNIAEDVVGAVRGMIDGWRALLSNVWDNVFREPLENIREKFEDFWEGLRDWITHIFDNIHIPLPHFRINWQEVAGVQIPAGIHVDWYAQGGDFVVRRPTLIGVGEAGPERVIVQPLGQQGHGLGREVHYHLNYYATRERPGYEDAAAAMRRLEWHVRMRMA